MLALTIGALVSGAAYLLLDRSYLRSVLGFLMLGHAVSLPRSDRSRHVVAVVRTTRAGVRGKMLVLFK